MPVSQPRGRVSPAQWPRGWSRTRASHHGAWPCCMVRSGLGSSRCGLWGCVHSRSASVAWASSLSLQPPLRPLCCGPGFPRTVTEAPGRCGVGTFKPRLRGPCSPSTLGPDAGLRNLPGEGLVGFGRGGGGLLPQGSRSLAPSARPLPWFIKPQFVSSTRVTADRLFERIVFTGFQDKSA